MDRIQAIRAMGRIGYSLGADALIGLLADCGEIPRAEVVSALESISGIAWGDDVNGWRAWWNDLPPEVRGGRESGLPEEALPVLPASSREAP